MWDGTRWLPLGSGFDEYVREIVAYKGQLIVGGTFRRVNGVSASRIARWNGQAWEPFGAEVIGNEVRAFAVAGDDLFVGGSFSKIGTLTVGNIAKWNGTSWSALATGVTGEVWSIAKFGSDIVAGGNFATASGTTAKSIARWNGSAWSPMGSGFEGLVRAICVFDGELIAGGSMSFVYGGKLRSYLARWNGAEWLPLDTPAGTSPGVIWSLAVHAGWLYLGGDLRDQYGASRNVQRWDGTNWDAPPEAFSGYFVSTLQSFRNEIFAVGTQSGGSFKLRAWNGQTWRALEPGFDGDVFAATTFRNEVVVAGNFETAGGVGASKVVRWDGVTWRPLGTGMDNTVLALTEFDGSLIAGGRFRRAGDEYVSYLARWSGEQWERIQPVGITTYADDFVGDLIVFRGQLIGAGKFHIPGGLLIHSIARWDGNKWQPLGAGIEYSSGEVNALAVFNGDLVATGTFLTAGGVSAVRIARWDGNQWYPLGSGLTSTNFGSGYALEVFNSELVVGGSFDKAGGISAKAIAKWDGVSWKAFSSPIAGGIVYVVESYRDQLVIGGEIQFPSDGPSGYTVARWTGSAWKRMGLTFDGMVSVLCAAKGELLAGGSFENGGVNPTPYFARWSETGIPWIGNEPASAEVNCAQPDAIFRAAVATGYGSLSYRWRKNSELLFDGITESGSLVVGSALPTLTIASALPADEGDYDCVVSSGCGDTMTIAARLEVLKCCRGDLDTDGDVDSSDFAIFLVGYNILECTDPAMVEGCPADLNFDGVVDDADFVVFVLAYNLMVCP